MKLDYVDPECTEEQEKEIFKVSSYMACKAYNDICKMLGGRWPDAKLQEEAPLAHEFFMTMFGHGKKNIRHELDPERRIMQTQKKIKELKEEQARMVEQAGEFCKRYEDDLLNNRPFNWSRRPTTPEAMHELYEGFIGEEREYYSKVRVIELPQSGKRFILVYGNADDSKVERGTGPFGTLAEAENWFFNGGR